MAQDSGPPGPEGNRGGSSRIGFPVLGFVILTIGIVLILQTTGVLGGWVWFNLLRFWPVLIIILGVSTIFGRRAPWLAGIMTFVLLAGSVIGAILLSDEIELVQTKLSEPLGSVEQMEANIQFGLGRLNVDSLPADSTDMFQLDLHTPSQHPYTNATRSGNQAVLNVRFDENNRGWFLWPGRRNAEWNISLSQTPAIKLDLDGGAATIEMDLQDLNVPDIEIDAGAANVKLTVPASAGQIDLSVNGGAMTLEITIPSGVEGRIKREGVANTSIDDRFVDQGDGVWQSAGYDAAQNRVNIDLQLGLATVRVR